MPISHSGFFGHGNEWLDSPSWDYSANFNPPTQTGTTRQPTQAASAASSFNLNSVGDIEKLTASLNNLNQQAQKTALAGRIPNNPALENQSSINIGNDLKGIVGNDELAYLNQAMAERGVSSGIDPTSPNANAAYLRALGTTSNARRVQGQQLLSAADARNPIAPIVDSSKYTLTPAESAQINLGYLTEADRYNIEQQQLAIERARGGGSHGGYGGGGPAFSPDSGTYQYAEPGIGPIGRAQGPGITGSDVLGMPNSSDIQSRWLASIIPNLNYATPVDYSRYGEGGSTPVSNTFGTGAQTYYGYDASQASNQDPWTYGG